MSYFSGIGLAVGRSWKGVVFRIRRLSGRVGIGEREDRWYEGIFRFFVRISQFLMQSGSRT
jgi:hypothetical protein